MIKYVYTVQYADIMNQPTHTKKGTSSLSVITPVKDDDRIYNLISDIKMLDFGTDLEFLIICNGSQKSFVENIKKQTQSVDNLRVFALKEARMASAVNFGLKQAKSPNVVVIDSDCLINKNTFESMVEALQNNPIARGVVVFKGTNFISKLSANLRTHVYEKEDSLSFCPNTGFQKKVFGEVGYFNDFPHNDGHTYDSEWSYRAKQHGLKLVRVMDSQIIHFCHTSAASEIKISFHYGQGRAYCYHRGLLGNKSPKNFLKAITIPVVFDRQEPLAFNLFVAFYVIIWNLGFLKESLFKQLP